jgi:hypothetical protein
MFCIGAFYFHGSAGGAGGLGYYSANLNAFANPQGMSRFIKDLPLATDGQYEGNAYIGLGIIMAVIMIFSVQLYQTNRFTRKTLFNPLKTVPYVMGLLLSFLLFSLSFDITFNQYKLFTYPVIPPVKNIWSIFRGTGRFTWPVIYICILFCVWWIIKKFSLKKGVAILVVLAVLQGADLKDWFVAKGKGFKTKSAWQTELEAPVWTELAKEYNHIFFLGDYLRGYSFLDLAANNNMDINDANISRKNATAINGNKQQEIAYLKQNGAKKDTLYIFADKEQAESLGIAALYLYDIDGVIIGTGSPPDYLNGYALRF